MWLAPTVHADHGITRSLKEEGGGGGGRGGGGGGGEGGGWGAGGGGYVSLQEVDRKGDAFTGNKLTYTQLFFISIEDLVP